MPRPKYVIPLLVVLLAAFACSSTPIVEERVIVVTATPTVNLEAESTKAPQPTSTPTPIPTPPPTSTPRSIPTPRLTATPRAWPFSDADGTWSINSEKDPVTDRERVSVGLMATNKGDNFLGFRCGYGKSDIAEVFVIFGDDLEAGGAGSVWVEVQWRFDDGEIESQRWGLSNNTVLFYLYAPTDFIWQAMHAQKLTIREQSGQTLTFDVAGLANALYPHRDKCNWIQP